MNADSRSALAGMQPQITQVPPSASRSMTAVERPSWAHRMAPTYPAGPPPRKITSYEAMSREVGNSGYAVGIDAAAADIRVSDRPERARSVTLERPAAATLETYRVRLRARYRALSQERSRTACGRA